MHADNTGVDVPGGEGLPHPCHDTIVFDVGLVDCPDNEVGSTLTLYVLLSLAGKLHNDQVRQSARLSS